MALDAPDDFPIGKRQVVSASRIALRRAVKGVIRRVISLLPKSLKVAQNPRFARSLAPADQAWSGFTIDFAKGTASPKRQQAIVPATRKTFTQQRAAAGCRIHDSDSQYR